MLVLARKRGQIVHIGDDITIEISDIKGRYVYLGITAPKSIVVDRAEVRQRRLQQQTTGSDLSDLVPPEDALTADSTSNVE